MGDIIQCSPFNGTSDFYGLGIRIGVYLQLASSHITNTLNQEAAPVNYAANSIFVFAIIVALLKAALASEIRPIEAWVMLQICISFSLTTLGLFGVRLYLLRPSSLQAFSEAVKQVDWKHLWTSLEREADYRYHEEHELGQLEAQSQLIVPDAQADRTGVLTYNPAQLPEKQKSTGRFRKWFRNIRKQTLRPAMMEVRFKMDSASFIKHSSLSWGGVAWRTSIVTIVACTNVWFWFEYADQLQEDQDDPCSPVVFFFAPFLLHSYPVLKWLFKVGSILMVLPLGGVVVWIFALTQMVTEYLYEVILRISIRSFIRSRCPRDYHELPERIKQRLDKVSPYIRFAMSVGAQAGGPGGSQISIIMRALRNEIWMKNENALPTFADLLKAYAYLSSKQAIAENLEFENSTEHSEKISWRIKFCSFCFQFWSVGTIIWFIAAIELTIRWNNILGVHTVGTTSQLIPLVIGVTSSALAAQELVLKWIKFKYKDWGTIDFEIAFGVFGDHSLQLINARRPPNNQLKTA